jgi:hypothetical protein
MRWAEHVAHIRQRRNSYRILVGKPEKGEGWEGNKEIYKEGTGCDD